MKNFKIYGFSNNNKILITDSEVFSSAATFDEEFSIKENMKSSLSFKISDKLDNFSANPFVSLIYPGAKIRLILDSIIYDFIIDNVSSEFDKDLIIYNISAEDYASMVYSKEAQGLTLDNEGSYTGTLRELVYEVLYKSRKNLAYENLNKNFLNFISYYDSNNFTFSTEYTSAISFTTTGIDSAYITFPRSKYVEIKDYIMYINVLGIPELGSEVSLIQLDANGSYLTTIDFDDIINTGLIELKFTPRNSASYFKVLFTNKGAGTLSLYDWKLKLDELQFAADISENLSLDPTFVENNFKGELGDYSYYKKVTLSLQNSNLYNALVEIAKLFKADLYFDYENKYINFINKELEYKYKGFKLSPEFNLNNLSRQEDYAEFLSAINIVGSEDVYSVFPDMPTEFKQYFSDCIENNFTGTNYFETYSTTSYDSIVEYIKTNYISNEDDYAERSQLIENFATAARKIPNFENRLYSLDYFYKTGKIRVEDYNSFNNIINNDLRKTNIKLRVYSDQYYTAFSNLSAKESEIDFLCKNITVELINQEEIIEKLLEVEIYSSTWVAYQNQLENSSTLTQKYYEDLMKVYNIVFDIITLEPLYLEHIEESGITRFTEDSYINLILNIYGYYNIYNNGLVQKINEVKDKIKELANKRSSNLVRIDFLNSKLSDINLTAYVKREFELEKSGLESENKSLRFLIGDYTNDPFDSSLKGQYQNQLYHLQILNNFLGNYIYKTTLIDYSTLVVGQDLNETTYWSSTGAASVVLSGNKDYAANGQEDVMIKLEEVLGVYPTATVSTKNNLEVSKKYRVSGLFKVPSNTGATLTVSTDISAMSYMGMVINSMLGDRWFVFEFYINDNTHTSKLYNFPSYTEVSNSYYEAVSGTITSNDAYNITFSLDLGEQVFIYRPRVEEVLDSMPSPDDIYSLYDNPLMINYQEDFSINFNNIEGLYDLLYNLNYTNNVNKIKNTIISNLYKNYERFLIEGYYENSDELDSEGLLEQALLAFETIKYPRLTYDLSIIDLSDIDGYTYLKINVGDKILISENEDRLYKSYQPESTKYLQIAEISYNLRDISNTKLSVRQDDETIKILQYILKATQ